MPTDHTPFNPTPEQRANLLRLAAHLDLGVTNLQFSMVSYQSDCGTVGCALGHGPSLGITKGANEFWRDYACRVFGADDGDSVGAWMFGSYWSRTDNTPRGAAARIRYALKNGEPSDSLEQRFGRAPLSYTVPDRVEGPTVPAKVSS